MTVLVLVDEILILTPRPDAACPHIEILLSGLAPSSPTTVLVERSVDQLRWEVVRGGLDRDVTGTALIRDFEGPIGVPVFYRATLTSEASGVFVTTASTQLDSDSAWVHDPLDPRGAVRVHLSVPGGVDAVRPTATTASFPQAVDVVTPSGSDLAVASIGRRQRASDVPVVLDALPQDSAALQTLLMTAGEVVVRGLPVWSPLDDVATVVVTGLSLSVVGGAVPRHRWSGSMTQVRPVSLRLSVPWMTWREFRELWPGMSFADLRAARPGWRVIDWNRNPEA